MFTNSILCSLCGFSMERSSVEMLIVGAEFEFYAWNHTSVSLQFSCTDSPVFHSLFLLHVLVQIGLESIPQAPMLRQGALIHRVDNWAQSKVWKPRVLSCIGIRSWMYTYIIPRLTQIKFGHTCSHTSNRNSYSRLPHHPTTSRRVNGRCSIFIYTTTVSLLVRRWCAHL